MFLLEILRGLFLGITYCANTKSPDMDFVKNLTQSTVAKQIVEPESGRMMQAQMINLVIGSCRVPQGSRA